MAKFTPGQLEEIARIKGEYYCGTERAVSIFRRVRESHDFAEERVNGYLAEKSVSARVTWQDAFVVQNDFDFVERTGDSAGNKLLQRALAAHETRVEQVGDLWARAVSGRNQKCLEYLADVRERAARTNEISTWDSDVYLVACCVGFWRREIPEHMVSLDSDTVYLRAREEGTLHCPNVQQAFLVRTAMAANAKNVDGLVEHFKQLYARGQERQSGFWGGVNTEIVVCDAASYGLGLLKRSDLRDWLAKYLSS